MDCSFWCKNEKKEKKMSWSVLKDYFNYTLSCQLKKKKKKDIFLSHRKHFFLCKWNLNETNMIDKYLTSKPWQHLMQVHLFSVLSKIPSQLFVFAITPTKLISASLGLSPMSCIYPWDALSTCGTCPWHAQKSCTPG